MRNSGSLKLFHVDFAGVKLNLSAWIDKLNCDGDIEKQFFFKKKFLQRLKTSPVAIETEKANEQHYEVPTEFFKTVSVLYYYFKSVLQKISLIYFM